MATPKPPSIPAKAVKHLNRLGYSRTFLGETAEVWLELRRFVFRRLKLGSSRPEDTASDNDLFRRLALAFLGSHGTHFFSEARKTLLEHTSIYDPGASDDEKWQTFKPLGDLIWIANSSNAFPSYAKMEYMPFLVSYDQAATESDVSDGATEGLVIVNNVLNPPINEPSPSAPSSDQPIRSRKRRSSTPLEAPPPKRVVSDEKRPSEPGPTTASWAIATQVEPCRLASMAYRYAKRDKIDTIHQRRVQFAFATPTGLDFLTANLCETRADYRDVWELLCREINARWRPASEGSPIEESFREPLRVDFRCANDLTASAFHKGSKSGKGERAAGRATEPAAPATPGRSASWEVRVAHGRRGAVPHARVTVYSKHDWVRLEDRWQEQHEFSELLAYCNLALAGSADDCLRLEIHLVS